MKNSEKTMEKIVALCKGRGFIFSGSEIYGGLANTWDYGPLERGQEMARRSPPLPGMKCVPARYEFRWNHGQRSAESSRTTD